MKSFVLIVKNSICLRYIECIMVLLLLGVGTVQAAESVFAQQLITLRVENKTLHEVFTELKNKSGYVFFYSTSSLNVNRRVSVDVVSQPIEKVLDEVLKGTNNSYTISGKQVFIQLSKKSQGVDQKVSTQQKKKGRERTIVGHVVDASDGEALIGATVKIAGTGVGALTDKDGQFSLNVTNKTQLEVTYIGYKKQVVTVGELGELTIKMHSDNQQLDEVVVVGAGTQKKVSVTGAITSVQGTELKAPTASLTTNFAGKLAGVVSLTGSGEPGKAADFYIRGISTFGGRLTPLILLDDVEISVGDLNNIPVESIQSFSILKDASATAIYGSRGANGVMLITTKHGSENEKTQIHITLENSFLKPMKRMGFVDGARFMELYNEADLTRNPNAVATYSQTQIDNTRNHVNPYLYPDVNWYKLLFKNSNMDQRANVNISGGGTRATYFMSIQVNHDTGMLDVPDVNSLSNNINRWVYIFQNNISYKLTPSTKIDLRINTQIANRKGPNADANSLFYDCYFTDPVSFPAFYPAQEGDKHIRFGNNYISGSELNSNPYAAMLSTFEQTNSSTLNTALQFSQDLDFVTKGLNVSALVNWKTYYYSYYTEGLDSYFYRPKEGTWSADDMSHYELEQLRQGSDYITQSGISKGGDNSFYFDGRLNYNRKFGDHTISGMLMYMMREYRSAVLPHRNQGFSGRFTYDFQNKYLAEINFGYNGTERLAKHHRFELFPAVSLGWVISNEDFWQPVSKYIDYFKIRGSYGLVGSDETGESSGAAHYLYRNIISHNSGRGAWFGDSGSTYYYGSAVSSYAVENGHWERAKKLDIGVDMHLLNQLNIVFDYFHEKRDRILMQRGCWPDVMGYWSVYPWSNIGKVDNKGMELSINWKKQATKDLGFEMRFNFTYNKNKVVYEDEPNYASYWQRYEGQPLPVYQTRGFIAEGLFKDYDEINRSPVQTNFGSKVMPGDIKYRDINGDGAITEDDRTMISSYGHEPRIQYGLGLDVTYKKFDFGVFFNGSAKRKIMLDDVTPFDLSHGHGPHNLMKFIADDYWSESNPNPDAKYPRLGLSATQTANNTVASTYWMRKGDFIRWKTLEIGYSFPHCRLYFSGDNLAVWSPFKLWDPEVDYWYSYPLQRTFNIGAQIKF